MVLRLQNTNRWSMLEPGYVLSLGGVDPRKVRVELNVPVPTRVDLVQGETTVFIGVVDGYEVVEFTAVAGPAELWFTTEEEVWFFAEEPDEYSENLEAVSFATIAQRRARNPELERMMFKLQENMERRLSKQQAEIDAWRAAHPDVDPEDGVIDDDAANGDATGAGGASGDDGAAAGGADAEGQGAGDGPAA